MHGVGGLFGTILVGALAAPCLGGNQVGLEIAPQLGVQSLAAAVTVVYTASLTWVILKVVDATVGLRVSEDEERHGLDVSLHNETGYNL